MDLESLNDCFFVSIQGRIMSLHTFQARSAGRKYNIFIYKICFYVLMIIGSSFCDPEVVKQKKTDNFIQ